MATQKSLQWPPSQSPWSSTNLATDPVSSSSSSSVDAQISIYNLKETPFKENEEEEKEEEEIDQELDGRRGNCFMQWTKILVGYMDLLLQTSLWVLRCMLKDGIPYIAVLSSPAFKGTAPTNLSDCLNRVLQWSLGSVKVLFSSHYPVCNGSRLRVLERMAYVNATIYPLTSIPLVTYCLPCNRKFCYSTDQSCGKPLACASLPFDICSWDS